MKTRSTIILAAIAVIVLGAGLYAGLGSREQQSELPTGQAAFPGLAGKLGDAATIEVSQAGKTVRLTRKGDQWTLPDKGGYPAQATKVHELLANLAELKLEEPRTSNADEYGRLGVAEPAKAAPKPGSKDADDKGATLVRVLDAHGGAIAQLLVGHSHVGNGGSGDGVYVRRPGEAQAWLASGSLSAQTDPTDWFDQTVVNIPADRIAKVAVTRGGQTLTFARQGDKLDLVSPAEHPPLDKYKIADIGRALDSLTMDDVKPAPAPGKPEGESVFTTKDGMTVTAAVNKDGSDIWATFAVTADDQPATDKSATDKAGDAKAAAATLAAKLKGWAYKLGSWKEAALVPTLDELKAPEPPKPPAPPAASKPEAAATPAPAAASAAAPATAAAGAPATK